MTNLDYRWVEETLDITLTAHQAMLVQNYLDNGVRPPASSCSGCDENYVRLLTDQIDKITPIQDTERPARRAKRTKKEEETPVDE